MNGGAGRLRQRWRDVRPGRPHLGLRATIVVGAILAVACTRAGGPDPVVGLEIAIVASALLAAGWPDTHLGLGVITLIGVNWFAAVDDTATLWAVGAGISIALVHTATAAATVAPLGASWTPAMYRRWGMRFLAVAAATLPAWAVTAGLGQIEVAGSSVIVTAALLLLAAAGLWLRHGDLEREPPAPT